ncbi:hypothetical protein R3P38DRAFT_894345, partial [Favolaschia claudopus]
MARWRREGTRRPARPDSSARSRTASRWRCASMKEMIIDGVVGVDVSLDQEGAELVVGCVGRLKASDGGTDGDIWVVVLTLGWLRSMDHASDHVRGWVHPLFGIRVMLTLLLCRGLVDDGDMLRSIFVAADIVEGGPRVWGHPDIMKLLQSDFITSRNLIRLCTSVMLARNFSQVVHPLGTVLGIYGVSSDYAKYCILWVRFARISSGAVPREHLSAPSQFGNLGISSWCD